MRSGIYISALILASRGTYLLLFLVIGNQYGANASTDTVLFIQAPLLVLMSAATGAAESIMMPALHRAARRGCSRTLVKLLIARFTTVLFPLSIATVSIATLFVDNASATIAALLIPMPILAALSAVTTGILNTDGRHILAATGALFGSSVAIALCFSLPANEISLALVLVSHEIGRLLWVVIGGQFWHSPAGSQQNPVPNELRRWVIRGALIQAAGSLALAANLLVDDAFALQLTHGSVTLVEYSSRLWVVFPLIASGPLLLVYASLSRKAAEGPLSKREVNRYAAWFGLSVLLLSAMCLPFTGAVVDLAYGTGELDKPSSDALADLLKFYVIGAGPYVAGLVYARAHSAEGRPAAMTAVATICVVINAVLNATLIPLLGLNGIALSTSIAYTINTILLAVIFQYTRGNTKSCKIQS